MTPDIIEELLDQFPLCSVTYEKVYSLQEHHLYLRDVLHQGLISHFNGL